MRSNTLTKSGDIPQPCHSRSFGSDADNRRFAERRLLVIFSAGIPTIILSDIDRLLDLPPMSGFVLVAAITIFVLSVGADTLICLRHHRQNLRLRRPLGNGSERHLIANSKSSKAEGLVTPAHEISARISSYFRFGATCGIALAAVPFLFFYSHSQSDYLIVIIVGCGVALLSSAIRKG